MAQFDKKTRQRNLTGINDEKEFFILEKLSEGKTCTEVSRLYHAKFPDDRVISPQGIRYYKETREDVIEEIRLKVINKMMHIPIANEKVRLKRMEDLYQAASNVVATDDEKRLNAIGVSLSCLREAREEVKGNKESPAIIFNQYNELTPEGLLDKKKELERKFIELSKKGDDTYGAQQGN